jgi:hypothetical protein
LKILKISDIFSWSDRSEVGREGPGNTNRHLPVVKSKV